MNHSETWYPHLVVASIIEHQGKFLMIEEVSDGIQVINQPAGHVEEGESLLQAVIRETLEETGWHAQINGLVGFYHYRSPHNGITYFRCCFHGQAKSQSDHPLDEGIIRTLWLSHAELKAQAARLRSPLVLTCLEDYLAGQRLPLESVTNLL